jgi:hypothetical protein
MKNDLKMKFEKKEKKNKTRSGSLSAQAAQPASRAGPPSPSPFSFYPAAPTAGAHLSASPLPFLSSSSRRPLPEPRRRAIPAAPGRLPAFLSSLCDHLRQLTFP